MMKAGWGAADMTPPVGVELAGYGYYLERRATHVRDPLFARAVAFECDGLRYAIVCCDVLGLSASLVSTVLAHLRDRHGVPKERAMIVSIHTHTGPALKYHEGCGEVDPGYAESAARPIQAACDRAFSNLAVVTGLRGGCAPLAEPFAYNRTSPDGPVDGLVRAFRIDRVCANPIAIASYACHPVTRGRISGISADYPGQVCTLLAKCGLLPLYLNGLCGDIDPAPCPKEARDARCEAFARAIVDGFTAALRPLPVTVRGGRLDWTLRLLPVTREDITQTARGAVARATDPGAQRVARTWEGEMLARFDALPKAEALSIAYLRLGGVPIVALPFEGFVRTGELIRAALRDPRALVLGCAEELLGYLPTDDDIDRGAYAALESSFLYKRLPPMAGEAERLGREVGRMLTEQR